MLSVIIMSVAFYYAESIILSVAKLNVTMVSVFMLSVVAPQIHIINREVLLKGKDQFS